MPSDSPNRASKDDGFTLIELLITIVLMGILAPVAASAFTVIVHNTPSVQTRTDDNRSTRGLSTWLPQDVLSTPPNLVTNGSSSPGYAVEPARGSDCGSAEGTNVLHMIWQEKVGTLTNYVANYRFVDSGDGLPKIKRYSCSGTGPPPYTNTRTVNVTTPIDATSALATPTFRSSDPSILPRIVTFIDVKAVTVSGVEVLIHAASRNPAEQLPNP